MPPSRLETIVLVVEDSGADARLLQAVLERYPGFSIRTLFAASAKSTAEILKRNPRIDLAIVDVLLEGSNGGSVVTMMRSHPKYRLTPIVMLTGTDDPDTKRRMLEKGANAFMVKPFGGLGLVVEPVLKVFLG